MGREEGRKDEPGGDEGSNESKNRIDMGLQVHRCEQKVLIAKLMSGQAN